VGRHVVLAFVLTAWASAACDGESSFTIPRVDPGAPDARYAAPCGRWAQAQCWFDEKCFAASVAWASQEQCVSQAILSCELLGSDPNVGYTPDQLAACPTPSLCSSDDGGGEAAAPEAAAPDAAAPDAAAPDAAAPDAASCQLAPGRARNGSLCVWDEACASGSCVFGFDTTGASSACGTCQPLPCGGVCPQGRRCVIEVDGGAACRPILPIEAGCSDSLDCSTFYCVALPAPHCAPGAKRGDPCGDGTTGPPCADPNTYCDDTGHCRGYYVSDYGAPCGDLDAGTYDAGMYEAGTYICRGFGTCDTTQNICVPPSTAGMVCDENQQLGCLWPARCIGNYCRYPSLALCTGSNQAP
jgi:hypothetical protein